MDLMIALEKPLHEILVPACG